MNVMTLAIDDEDFVICRVCRMRMKRIAPVWTLLGLQNGCCEEAQGQECCTYDSYYEDQEESECKDSYYSWTLCMLAGIQQH